MIVLFPRALSDGAVAVVKALIILDEVKSEFILLISARRVASVVATVGAAVIRQLIFGLVMSHERETVPPAEIEVGFPLKTIVAFFPTSGA